MTLLHIDKLYGKYFMYVYSMHITIYNIRAYASSDKSIFLPLKVAMYFRCIQHAWEKLHLLHFSTVWHRFNTVSTFSKNMYLYSRKPWCPADIRFLLFIVVQIKYCWNRVFLMIMVTKLVPPTIWGSIIMRNYQMTTWYGS